MCWLHRAASCILTTRSEVSRPAAWAAAKGTHANETATCSPKLLKNEAEQKPGQAEAVQDNWFADAEVSFVHPDSCSSPHKSALLRDSSLTRDPEEATRMSRGCSTSNPVRSGNAQNAQEAVPRLLCTRRCLRMSGLLFSTSSASSRHWKRNRHGSRPKSPRESLTQILNLCLSQLQGPHSPLCPPLPWSCELQQLP